MPSSSDSHACHWQDWLVARPTAVYKQDGRSRVWRVDVPGDVPGVVLKRFEYSPIRQRLGWLTGIHPACHEIRQARRMIADGLPVVPLLGWHVASRVPGFPGCRVTLASPFRGRSMLHMLRRVLHEDPAGKVELLAALGQVAAQMIQAGWVFRDFKTANVLVDERQTLWLIDVGSARKVGPVRHGQAGGRTWRMLRMIDQSLSRDHCTPEQRIACLARPLACICPEPVAQAYDRLGRIVLK